MRFGRRQRDSLFDGCRVDVVSEAADGVVDLVIVQDRPWTGSEAQLASLQAKVQAYVSFALDGGLARQYPEVSGRPWRILVHCQTGLPDPNTQSLLDVLTTRLPEYGGSLLVRRS